MVNREDDGLDDYRAMMVRTGRWVHIDMEGASPSCVLAGTAHWKQAVDYYAHIEQKDFRFVLVYTEMAAWMVATFDPRQPLDRIEFASFLCHMVRQQNYVGLEPLPF